MRLSEAYHWLIQGERRQQILLRMKQPMTAKQLSLQTGLQLNSCSYVLWELSIYELVYCLNNHARKSRLYWLTQLGKACERKLCEQQGLSTQRHDCPDTDWTLYGWVCFSPRAAIIKTLTGSMQPSHIKKAACFQNRDLRMSANNVRDVTRLFLRKGIVRRVAIRGKAHPRYELTEVGRQFQLLLLRAEEKQVS